MDLEILHGQLLALSRETFLAGHHRTACCLLHAVAQCARDMDDRALLAEAGQLARNRELSLTRRGTADAAVFRALVKTVEEMLAELPEANGAVEGSDRRAAPRRRVACPVPVRLFSPAGEALGDAVADDVSEMGIRLLVSSAHEAGTVLVVESGPEESPGPGFAFRVAWSRQLDEGFLLAGPFVPPYPTAETLAHLWGL